MTGGNKKDYLFKILLVGNSGVGKSCMLLRYCDDAFTESYVSTIGVDFKIRTIETDDAVVKLQIWDTAGQERFRTITTSYYRGAHGIIIVYDITELTSFTDVESWLKEVRTYANDSVTLVIVGNKCDQEAKRNVPRDVAQAFARNHKLVLIETSAKGSFNVEAAFTQMMHDIRAKIDGGSGIVRQPSGGAFNVGTGVRIRGGEEDDGGDGDRLVLTNLDDATTAGCTC